MYLVYEALLAMGLITLLPYFLFNQLRGKQPNLGGLFGKLPRVSMQGRPIFWLHCVSFREVRISHAFVEAFRKTYPESALVISTTTHTGYRSAQTLYDEKTVFLFPFDFGWCVRRFLLHIRPSGVLIVGSELWPRFLRECSVLGIPVAVINGHLSTESFRRYSRIRFFMRRVLDNLSLAIMDTEIEANRMAALGLSKERIRAYAGTHVGYNNLEAVVKEVGERFYANDLYEKSTRPRIFKPPGSRLYRVASFFHQTQPAS